MVSEFTAQPTEVAETKYFPGPTIKKESKLSTVPIESTH